MEKVTSSIELATIDPTGKVSFISQEYPMQASMNPLKK
jgi:hypothetical protein